MQLSWFEYRWASRHLLCWSDWWHYPHVTSKQRPSFGWWCCKKRVLQTCSTFRCLSSSWGTKRWRRRGTRCIGGQLGWGTVTPLWVWALPCSRLSRAKGEACRRHGDKERRDPCWEEGCGITSTMDYWSHSSSTHRHLHFPMKDSVGMVRQQHAFSFSAISNKHRGFVYFIHGNLFVNILTLSSLPRGTAAEDLEQHLKVKFLPPGKASYFDMFKGIKTSPCTLL